MAVETAGTPTLTETPTRRLVLVGDEQIRRRPLPGFAFGTDRRTERPIPGDNTTYLPADTPYSSFK